MKTRWITIGAGALLLYAFITSLPEMRRYRRMLAM